MFIVAHGARSVMRLLRFLTREKQHYIRHIQLIELCDALGPSIPLQVSHVRDEELPKLQKWQPNLQASGVGRVCFLPLS